MFDAMSYLIARAGEPSTWRGLIWLLTAFGVSLSQEQAAAIVAAGAAIAGLFGVFTPDRSGSQGPWGPR